MGVKLSQVGKLLITPAVVTLINWHNLIPCNLADDFLIGT